MPERITVTPSAASSWKASATSRAPARVVAVTRRRSKITNCGRGSASEPARDVVDIGERQRADQFDHAHLLVVRGQDLLLLRSAHPPRRVLADVVIGDDAVAGVVAAVEHVQVVMRRQRLADLDAAHAVAVLVEFRRIAAEPEPGRQRRQDAAADAALGGNADRGRSIRRRSRTCPTTSSPRACARSRRASRTCSPVTGLMPRLARVAAITAISRAVTRMAHCRK